MLGVGGVGGLIGGALAHAGERVVLVAREQSALALRRGGLTVKSVSLGEFHVEPEVVPSLAEPVDVLVVATKATGLEQALVRIASQPRMVLPLLNGLDHLDVLRGRFGTEHVLAGSIRVEADRPEQGLIVHSSPFLRVDMAGPSTLGEAMSALAQMLTHAGIPARVRESPAEVMWSKLVRLNALACATSAFDRLLGEIRSTPELREQLVGAIEEGCEVALAEGVAIEPSKPIAELDEAHATLGSSMQRDIARGVAPELDAIPGAVLRAAARHGLQCPTIERLVAMISARSVVGVSCVATAATISSTLSRCSSCSPSQSTRKLPETPPSTWIVMPGRISSPSSKPSLSRSKCASPMP